MSTASADSPADTRSFVRKIDDAVFAVEQTVVVTFLSAMTLMVFIDVVDRRLTAPDSKIGELLARIGGVENEATRAMLDGTVAPILGGVVGFLLLVFGFGTVSKAEKKFGAPTFVRAIGAAAMLAMLGWIMTAQHEVADEWGGMRQARLFPSKYFYLLLYALVVVPWTLKLLRNKPKGWEKRVLGFVVGGGLLAYFGLTYFPDEYSWSLEVSGIMLLWVGSLGASVCVYTGKHIRLEALQKTVPGKFRKYVIAGGFFVAAGFIGFLAYLGYDYVAAQIEFHAVFEQTGIPDWVASIAIPVAFLLAAIRFAGGAVSALQGGSYGVSKNEELAAAAAALEELKAGGADASGSDSDSEAESEADADTDADADERGVSRCSGRCGGCGRGGGRRRLRTLRPPARMRGTRGGSLLRPATSPPSR